MAKFYYGGQAVIEGVMMRGQNSLAVAIRKPDQNIYVYEEKLTPKIYQNKLFRLPFLRGMILMWEVLGLGSRILTLSANVATGALDPDAPKETTEKGEKPEMIGGAGMVGSLLVSLSIAVAVFFVGPMLVANLLQPLIGGGWLNLLVEGGIRLLLLLGYLYFIGRIPDIQRVFGYHGAEHKAINAMEHGQPLDVAHVRQATRLHTRCGTGFILIVAVISIFVFALVGSPIWPIKILSRILLVPVVAGIAYEVMRLGANFYHVPLVRWLLTPALALQGLTTREPDDGMIECAIAALERVLQRDKEAESAHDEVPVNDRRVVTEK
ncbi:uncharacterized protein YqhQ [Thermosporothrix hazakensis]|jgi:uncharacterized protein YqhQ|uniref:Uncharacterized protein YqhQ n=2 Tax=Thermosporothrix TaxID=768650 RepID=A0A326UF91_THEHA|nr:DUF1385 domain-containing protein [Thermosporothrix hazakensis]PZW36694.1 uncharacterized protein YqhQ [Thermosporothrix hazakensis]BBH89162.1 hypothetical protein KTC_39130 [Thermosporothrix sp. COM3]GCE47345.1 hypothetical protein KTH_22140 [Thermosporothrix hazakensis]